MRSSPLEIARRAFLTLARGTVDAVDDSTKIQSMQVRMLQNELLAGVERFQQYGFSSVPVASAGQAAAEVVVAFIGGNRAHPIIIATDDRRSRPQNWGPGDAGLWHYQGATGRITMTGWQYDAGPQKQPHVTTVGSATIKALDGQITAQVGSSTTLTVEDGTISAQASGCSIIAADGKLSATAGGPPIVVKSDFVYLGGDPDDGGTYAFISTSSGPSAFVKARVS